MTATSFQFDYIIWTGDLISHDDWDQTRVEQLNLVNYLADMFLTYFPNTPVYWSLGNHEGVPVNRYRCLMNAIFVFLIYMIYIISVILILSNDYIMFIIYFYVNIRLKLNNMCITCIIVITVVHYK